MNYQETLDWLFAQLPMYQREGQAAYKANLNNTLFLDEHFHHPHRQFKTIHVAGTNGKGSVSHMLASILQEAGYKTGLYTSPHLKDFRERIKVNGEMVSEQYVIDFVGQNQALFAELKPSFFEMTVAMAFQYFADTEVDIAVIEVGLGGRLDSTNIITPLASIIPIFLSTIWLSWEIPYRKSLPRKQVLLKPIYRLLSALGMLPTISYSKRKLPTVIRL